MDLKTVAENINILGEYCGLRDIGALNREELIKLCHQPQADLLILFGGSIPCGCDAVGKAMQEKIAKKLMIVGGEGHTTESLRRKIRRTYPRIETAGRMEADIMHDYLKLKYEIDDCLIERKSTNCGNNVTNAIALMEQNGIHPKSLILVQDATMQRRMDAGFRKYLKPGIRLINFASYRIKASVRNETLVFEPADLWGMWTVRQYVTLLMGEIPRLTDNPQGYGPNGKDFIAHVDIPREVRNAFDFLKTEYGDFVRAANPSYRTVK